MGGAADRAADKEATMALPMPTGVPYDPRDQLPFTVARTGVNGCFEGWNNLLGVLAQILPDAQFQLVGATELV